MDDGPRSGVGFDDADRLGVELGRLVRLLDRAYAQFIARHDDGLERATYVLLAHLVRNGPRRITELAEQVLSDPSTVSRQIAVLVKAGLVQRQNDPEDRRASQVAPTPAGEELFDRHRRIRNEHLVELLSCWTGQQVGNLIELLGRFNDEFDHYRSRHVDRPRRAERTS